MTSGSGKRRRQRPRSRTVAPTAPAAGRGTRSKAPAGAPQRRLPLLPLAVAGTVFLGAVALLAFSLGVIPIGGPQPSPASALRPPDATPLADPPTEPAGDGTRAVIDVPDGRIVIELFTDSSPVAAQNFINLAEAGFYDGVVFHRIVPGFVVQGGDPEGTGRGGPGYGIPDEPVVGEYVRGTVAMARSQLPNSQGSQFFIVLDDSVQFRLDKAGGYAIFGRVVEGMEVVDRLAELPNSGPPTNDALVRYQMDRVTIERP